MANTTNLNLEELTINDNLKTTFVNKLNSNQNKIDTAYGTLRDNLLENTGKDNLVEAINSVAEMSGTINDLQDEVNSLITVGDANASDIVNGKTALVQGVEITGTGFAETTTATSDDIIVGKTAYSNNGELITGTKEEKGVETIELTITNSTSNAIESINFNFSKDISNARIIYQAYPSSTSISTYYSPARYVLMNYDTSYEKCTCLYQSSRQYYSYAYSLSSASSFTFNKNGTQLTITNTNTSYGLRAYGGIIVARVTAIWE